jgi:hypothetical protein
MAITSAPGRGTRLDVHIPIPPAAQDAETWRAEA